MTTSMNRYPIAALLVLALSTGCEKKAVQTLPVEPLLSARIKFFNFGVNAPSVNFYAGETKMTAIISTTGSEATTGVSYGAVGNGGAYSQIAPGSYSLTGRIAAITDNGLPIDTLHAMIADGKYYSLYLSGFYNTTTKTVDAFIIEDPVTPPPDYNTALVRFVNTMSNAAYPLTLYARNTTVGDTTVVGSAVAYQGAGAFTALPGGIYDLIARYADSTTNKFSRTAVTLLGGRVYTVGARGDITVTSTTATNRPFLDATANR
jgi:hypothetical protein